MGYGEARSFLFNLGDPWSSSEHISDHSQDVHRRSFEVGFIALLAGWFQTEAIATVSEGRNEGRWYFSHLNKPDQLVYAQFP